MFTERIQRNKFLQISFQFPFFWHAKFSYVSKKLNAVELREEITKTIFWGLSRSIIHRVFPLFTSMPKTTPREVKFTTLGKKIFAWMNEKTELNLRTDIFLLEIFNWKVIAPLDNPEKFASGPFSPAVGT